MGFRLPGEPAQRPSFYPGLAAAQNVGPANGGVLHVVTATNLGASAASMTISDSTSQIGTLEVPAHDTRSFVCGPGANYTGQLAVTPSAALDVTVILLPTG